MPRDHYVNPMDPDHSVHIDEVFTEFRRKRLEEPVDSEIYVNRSIYKTLAEDPSNVEVFSKLKFEDQVKILSAKSLLRTNADTFSQLFRLLAKTGLSFTDVDDWTVSSADRRQDHNCPTVSKRFEEEFFDFYAFHSTTDTYYPGRFDEIVVLLLLKEHGEDTLVEVMNLWISSRISASMTDFEALVENWSQVRHMPIAWSLDYLGLSHTARKVTKKTSHDDF